MFHFHILMWLGREMDMEEDFIKDRVDVMMFLFETIDDAEIFHPPNAMNPTIQAI